MYRIFILTDDTKLVQQLGFYTKKYCEQNGSFPILRQFENSEEFCNALKTEKPTGVIIALPGVAGLNASERLRLLCPNCGLIWYSDLDFSLQAYRLRADYFFEYPPTTSNLCDGLSVWIKHGKARFKRTFSSEKRELL